MREGVAHLQPRITPIGAQRRRGVWRGFGPWRAGPAQHAAQKPMIGAGFQQHGAIGAAHQIGEALPHRLGLFGQFARQVRRDALRARPAHRHQRADATGGRPGGADGRAQIHHGLRVTAGARHWGQCLGQRLQLRLGGGQRRLHREQPCQHPFHIAIHHGGGPVKGNRGNGGRSIGADARQIAQPCLGVGKDTAMLIGHDAGAFQQVARAGVIPKARPFGHDRRIFRRRQRADRGPTCREAVKIVAHGGHGGLLQHDFGQPDPVGIGAVAHRQSLWPNPPRQRAGVAIIPRQKRRTDRIVGKPVTQGLSAPSSPVIG